MTKRLIKIPCQNCKASGYTLDRGAQICAGIFTVGMAPLLDAMVGARKRNGLFSERCRICEGNGYQEVDA